jgi:hypothetical protein
MKLDCMNVSGDLFYFYYGIGFSSDLISVTGAVTKALPAEGGSYNLQGSFELAEDSPAAIKLSCFSIILRSFN